MHYITRLNSCLPSRSEWEKFSYIEIGWLWLRTAVLFILLLFDIPDKWFMSCSYLTMCRVSVTESQMHGLIFIEGVFFWNPSIRSHAIDLFALLISLNSLFQALHLWGWFQKCMSVCALIFIFHFCISVNEF